MRKSVLAIGGSMFNGRVFSIQASKNDTYDLHVVNRGRFPLNLHNVREYKCDRHSPGTLARAVPDIRFDALIDFCAYTPGEITSVMDALAGRIRQYILFSTASVYAPAAGAVDEKAPLLQTFGGGAVDEYIKNKLLLEEELTDACRKNGIAYTILRPAFIYGPLNYAPRESYYIELIAKKNIVPIPSDAAGRWSFVYVFDVSKALCACIDDNQSCNEIFNLSAPEICSYESLMAGLRQFNGGDFKTRQVTIREVADEGLPLPFPLDTGELYDGQKICRAMNFKYTPFETGMAETFKIFYSLYAS